MTKDSKEKIKKIMNRKIIQQNQETRKKTEKRSKQKTNSKRNVAMAGDRKVKTSKNINRETISQNQGSERKTEKKERQKGKQQKENNIDEKQQRRDSKMNITPRTLKEEILYES